ncbi:hypothetical protein ACONDI_00526 [Natranaerofaba carboxydovora]|nr:hypothetical protein ACONDI_00526 [Natranaerofaba carboxydovora]
MHLIILSVLTGFLGTLIGFLIGVAFGSNFLMYIFMSFFGLIGVLTPGLYVLDKLYNKFILRKK